MTVENLQNLIADETSKNYTEGYIKGVHDADALLFLKVILEKHHALGMLRNDSKTRAFAQFFWNDLEEDRKQNLNQKIKYPHPSRHRKGLQAHFYCKCFCTFQLTVNHYDTRL